MGAVYTNRMMRLMATLKPVTDLLNDPVFNQRNEDRLSCDFALGNPQEMPLQGFVDALGRALHPKDKDWFAYKLSEQPSREIMAGALFHWRGIEFDPDDIFMTNGAFGGLAVTLSTIIDPGDEVIFISPPWFFYEAMIISYGGEPIRVKVDPDTLSLDLDAIEAAITPRTRAIIINSPNNPTGKIYSPESLTALGEILRAASITHGHTVYLISDESYSKIIYDQREFPSPTRYYPYSFLIYTYGKTLLTPGQRIGYIAMPPDMPNREDLRPAVFVSQMITGYAFPNALLQHALGDLEKLSIDIDHLQQKRDRMVRALADQGYELHNPEGTFYLLPRSPIPDDLAFAEMLKEEHIHVLPGSVCEMPGYFRLSLTASDEMIDRGLPGFGRAIQRAKEKASSRA